MLAAKIPFDGEGKNRIQPAVNENSPLTLSADRPLKQPLQGNGFPDFRPRSPNGKGRTHYFALQKKFMQKLLFTLLLAASLGPVFGQKGLSFVNDRRFKDPSDLLGFNFRPAEKEIKGSSPKAAIKPGSVSFGITRSKLFVEGEGIGGVFDINQINSVDFGFKLTWLDARNPAESGHLKIILNPRGEADALVFKKGAKAPEIIFFLADLPEELGKKESKFFTDKGELILQNKDSLWGKTIRPFHRLHQNLGIQERLTMADSTSLFFFETVEIIDKTKKKKESGKKAEATQKPENQSVATDSTAVVAADSTAPDPKKIKIIKRHFVRIKGLYKYEDGSQQLKTDEFEIKNVAWREDKNSIDPDDHFLLEIELEKHEPLLLYLSAKQAVSYLEFDGLTYLMRGF